MAALQAEIVRLFDLGSQAREDTHARSKFDQFLNALTTGQIRAAEKQNGGWKVKKKSGHFCFIMTSRLRFIKKPKIK